MVELTEFLKHDELNTEKEEYLLEFIFRWLNHDTERAKYLYELLQCLRYPLMDFEFIVTKFKNCPLLKINKNVKKLTKKICKGCTQIYLNTNNSSQNSLACLTKEHRIPPQVVLLIGGWNAGRALDIVECYNRRSSEWFITKQLKDPAGGRCYFGMGFIHNAVYLIGKNYFCQL